MKDSNNDVLPSEVDADSWEECQSRLNEKYLNKKSRVTSASSYSDGVLRSETVITHKNRSAAGTIIVTAIVFLLIGALISAGILFVRFAGLDEFGRAAWGGPQGPGRLEQPVNTPDSWITAPPPANESGDPAVSTVIPLTEIYKDCVNGVVLIRNYDSERMSEMNIQSIGAGFFISNDGYIMTNAHVIEDAAAISVVLYDGSELRASVVGTDVTTDIAVIKVSGENNFTALKAGNSDDVEVGEFVLTIGHPTGEELKFSSTFGTVSAVNRLINIDGRVNSYIQVDAAINPGNSGGPLLNMNGEVIGINSAKTVNAGYDNDNQPIAADGLGFAIPINKAMEVANSLIQNGSIVRPGIGVSVITITADMAEAYDIPQGILVYSVVKDGPGHKAGLYADDIITKADGISLTSKEQFIEIIASHAVGDSVELEFLRDGEEKTCVIVIGDLNEIGSEVLDNAYGGGKYGLR